MSIDEIPQPRDWGTVQLSAGKEVLISRDMLLVGSDQQELLDWIQRNIPKIKTSGFQSVQFDNVSEPLRRRIHVLTQ